MALFSGLAKPAFSGTGKGSFLAALRDKLDRDRLLAAQAIVQGNPAAAMQIRARSQAIDAQRAEAKERARRQRMGDMMKKKARSGPEALPAMTGPTAFDDATDAFAGTAPGLGAGPSLSPIKEAAFPGTGGAAIETDSHRPWLQYGSHRSEGDPLPTVAFGGQGMPMEIAPTLSAQHGMLPPGHGFDRPALRFAAAQEAFERQQDRRMAEERARDTGRDPDDVYGEMRGLGRQATAPARAAQDPPALAPRASPRATASGAGAPLTGARAPSSGSGNSPPDTHTRIGSLSEQFESHGPGTVSTGQGDRGGASYGSWQLASRYGKPEDFLAAEGSRWASEFSNLRSGTPEFTRRWQAIATREPEAFQDAQWAYIHRNHYQPTISSVLQATGVDLHGHSQTLRDAVWSASVQHSTAPSVLARAISRADGIASRTDSGYEEVLINSIYDERVALLRDLIRSRNTSPAQRANYRRIIAGRYVSERREALRRYRLEAQQP